MMEKIPVYCTADTKVDPKDLTKVPVEFDIYLIKDTDTNMLFYEGDHLVNTTLDGVMVKTNDNFVLANKTNKKTVIRKGEILGHVYSMFCDEERETVVTEHDWNEERIISDVKIGDHLSELEVKAVRDMLLQTRQSLSKGDSDIGMADVQPHKIEITQDTPIWQKARIFSDPVNEEIERQCSELLSTDILEYSNSQYSSPVVPVRKQDGSLRLCVDYRKVNQVTRKENYPMPNLMKCVYKPNKVNYFTKLDLVRGYYQVPIAEESRPYTAFSTPQHHYQFKRLSFGLKNSGMAFQKIMQQVLAPLLSHNVIIYIDDILITSETFEDHLNLVQKVLTLLRNFNIKVKVSKCDWFKREVEFLGHIISSKGIRKSPEYVEKVVNAGKPETVKGMRKFLGLINFQRKFVEKCSLFTKSLTPWTVGKRSKRIVWTEKMTADFNTLKEEIAKDIMLCYPDYNEQASKMELYVDASESGSGACLMQTIGGEKRVIAYSSMIFFCNSTEIQHHG